jgi:uncharacterized membrane protein
MKRYEEVDILKGIAVICMIIFHLFYFPNQYGFKEIEYDNLPLKTTAKVAQVIFITCVGINLVFSYYISQEKKESSKEYLKKNIFRVMKLGIGALFMTLFTYFVFGEKYVKFGILHFIAFASLLLFPYVDNMKVIYGILTFVFILWCMSKNNPGMFSSVPPKTAFLSGFYFKWGAVDHFPIMPWIIFICLGIIIGHYIYKHKPTLPDSIKDKSIMGLLETTGKYSFEIYIVHWLVIYLIFCIIYPKFRKSYPLINQ